MAIAFFLWLGGRVLEKEDEPKDTEAISIVEHFCTPGSNLQVLLNGEDWKQRGTWSVVPWLYDVDGEAKRQGMTDMRQVDYSVTVMDGLQERTLNATFGVDLATKAHSPVNPTAKAFFVCF